MKPSITMLISYTMLAYYKAQYPLEFYCTYFSTYVDEFDADLLINNASSLRKKMYNMCKQEATWDTYRQLEMMEVCLEMYEMGYTFITDNIKKDRFTSFFIEDGKLRPRVD